MKDISQLRQELIRFDRERRDLHRKMLQSQKLISGSLYLMYKKCGRRTCKCHDGEKHGPFLCLSTMKKKKRGCIFIRKKDETKVKHLNWKYQKFTEMIKNIEVLDQKIIKILKKIRNRHEVKYP